jgi:hypothetical protein
VASWSEVEAAAPELAERVKERFAATGLGLLATLRADGSPRISGIEPLFALDELWLGMMDGSRKATDLLRPPRDRVVARRRRRQTNRAPLSPNAYGSPPCETESSSLLRS